MSTSTQSQQQQQQKQQGQGQQIPIHESSNQNQNQNQNQRTMQSNRNQNQNENQRSMQSNRNMNRNMNRRHRNYNYNDDMFDSPIERVFKSFLGDDYDNMSLMNRNNNMGLNTPSFRANMIEKQNEYEVHGDLPGMNKQDINITFKDGTLEIEGKRENKVDEWDEKHQVHHKEVEYGSFYRTFYLPKSQNVNIKDVKAQYNNGVLNVHVPKDKQQDTQQYKVNID